MCVIVIPTEIKIRNKQLKKRESRLISHKKKAHNIYNELLLMDFIIIRKMR